MAKVLVSESYLTAIANAIRSKLGSGTWDTLFDSTVSIVSDSPNYIVINTFTETIANGDVWRVTWKGTAYTFEAKYSSEGGTYYIGNPGAVGGTDDGSGATFFLYKRTSTQLAGVTTDSPGSMTLKIEKQLSSGSQSTFKPSQMASAINSIVTSSAPNLQSKTNISPTTSSQTITADSGYDGLSSVQINAMPSGSATTPATTITSSPTISVSSGGLITASNSKTQSVTPTVSAGYVSSGTAGTITVSGSNTSQLTTQAAQTIHPSTSDQTITSGKYLTGTQTIKAVTMTNLTAANIKSGVVVKVGDSTDDDCVTSVTGTYTGGGGSSLNMQWYQGYQSIQNNGYKATNVKLTVAQTGTYTVSWTCWRGSSSGTMKSRLYIGDTAQAEQTTWTNTYGQHVEMTNVSLTANQTITVYASSGSNSRYIGVSNLIIKQTA